jgi:hypothetical protein
MARNNRTHEDKAYDLFQNCSAVGETKPEPSGDGGTDYRVFPAEGFTLDEVADQLEHAPADGFPVAISSARDWVWFTIRPRD